jgi:hypothetical protein
MWVIGPPWRIIDKTKLAKEAEIQESATVEGIARSRVGNYAVSFMSLGRSLRAG